MADIAHRTRTKMTRRGAWCPSTPPYPRPSFPLPPHRVLRLLFRPRRQKLLHHRRMTIQPSPNQRRVSILRRGAAVRQAPPSRRKCVRPTRTRPSRIEPPMDRARRPLQLHAPNTPKSAAESLHSAASGSGQAGTPSLRASACAPSRTYRPLCTTPPQNQPV